MKNKKYVKYIPMYILFAIVGYLFLSSAGFMGSFVAGSDLNPDRLYDIPNSGIASGSINNIRCDRAETKIGVYVDSAIGFKNPDNLKILSVAADGTVVSVQNPINNMWIGTKNAVSYSTYMNQRISGSNIQITSIAFDNFKMPSGGGQIEGTCRYDYVVKFQPLVATLPVEQPVKQPVVVQPQPVVCPIAAYQCPTGSTAKQLNGCFAGCTTPMTPPSDDTMLKIVVIIIVIAGGIAAFIYI